ncbi:MAG: hypothetical protein GX078_08755 [Clostridiales bacterium]|nr:hypothetical protein [Clostridiales bacterium]
MRVLMILAGAMTGAVGLFCSVNAGYPFITVAFIVGIVAIFSGIIEILVTDSVCGCEESKPWVRIEGVTSIILGLVFLSNQITEDVAIVSVFGLWIMITGLRIIPRLTERYDKNSNRYYVVLAYAVVASCVGVYSFFNTALFNFDTLMLVGIILLLQGINHLRIALLMEYKKPDIIKSQIERLVEAKVDAAMAKEQAKEALKAAKDAKANVDKIYKERDRGRSASRKKNK